MSKSFELTWQDFGASSVNATLGVNPNYSRGSVSGETDSIQGAVKLFERLLRSAGYEFHNVVVNMDDPNVIPKPISYQVHDIGGWGGWKLQTEGIKALTSADIQALTSNPVSYPTMGALTKEQVTSYGQHIPMPGTIGGAKYKY